VAGCHAECHGFRNNALGNAYILDKSHSERLNLGLILSRPLPGMKILNTVNFYPYRIGNKDYLQPSKVQS
jgi:hypothetical protein